jgi:alpha-L-arabinofuranosidase
VTTAAPARLFDLARPALLLALLVAAWSGNGLAANHELVIYAQKEPAGPVISRNIYGHFVEHVGRGVYGGIWVGADALIPNVRGIRRDLVEALRRIRVPVLRWPGGCVADEYHWRDGVGPRDQRPATLNLAWGQVAEDNQFGTHEFLDLCEQVGAEPYVAANVGSGSVGELQEWVEYLTHDGDSPMALLRRANGRDLPWRVRFFGIGNESWGCGGHMRPEHYADVYRHFQTFVHGLSGNVVEKIAAGASAEDYNWTEVLMREAASLLSGISLHYYVVPGDWQRKGSATRFEEAEWFEAMRKALRASQVIGLHAAIMDRHDPENRVFLAVDEWGTWYDVEPGQSPSSLYQQNTLRDALVAGIMLNAFNRHADRVRMANLAQMVNVLQALVLTEDRKMLLTPTYHVFDMYQVHQDAVLLPIDLRGPDYWFDEERVPALDASASRDAAGRIHVSLCNLDPRRPVTLSGLVRGSRVGRVSGRALTGESMSQHNTFAEPRHLEAAPLRSVEVTEEGFVVTLPARSVVVLELE